ncbi:hypothetical protein DV451_004552 [Geotrichum candidum]|uniref:C2H2-type domain-containing protein n=1 Tax=Geotrichum candidum TaxID=1173061 RepID=A0A9P5G1Q6_GEOCN|nr:hypothetical protein DV451_004552 [Geotrichum candidum]KAF5105416.1 hypothetical protein DV453_004838 [Geotrichum candidum]
MPPSSNPPNEKVYHCTFEGCTKFFNRRDYLDRHAASPAANAQKEPFGAESLLTFQITNTSYNPYTNTLSRAAVPSRSRFKRHSKAGGSQYKQHQTVPPQAPQHQQQQQQQSSQQQQQQQSQQQHQQQHYQSQQYQQNYQQHQNFQPQFALQHQQQLPPFSAIQPVYEPPQSQHDSASPPRPLHLKSLSFLGLGQQLQPQAQPQHQQHSPAHPSYPSGHLSQPTVPQATLPKVQKNTDMPHHERRSLFDTYSFFFEEQDHLDNNAIEVAQKSWYYHQCQLDNFPAERIVPLSNKAYNVNPERTDAINKVMFGDDKAQYLTTEELTKHIKYTWHGLETTSTVLHRPSFDINAVAVTLAATLIYIGMVAPSRNRAKFQFIYRKLVDETLSALAVHKKTQSFYENLNYYQALTFLCWYNYELALTSESLHPNMEEVSTDLYRYVMIGSAFHRGKDSEINLGKATVNSEAYTFFPTMDPAEQEEQWLTWITHESFVRAAYFCSLSELMRKFVTQSKVGGSVVDSDFVMICPLPLWRATSTEMFFQIVGPSRSIMTVSYLFLLKSMLRLPSILDDGTKEHGMITIQGKNVWTLGHLFILIYGLASIGWVVKGCTYYQQMHKSQKLLDEKEKSHNKNDNGNQSSNGNNCNNNSGLQECEPRLFPEAEYSSDTNGTPTGSTLHTVVDKRAQSRLFQALEMISSFCFDSSLQFLNPQISNRFTPQEKTPKQQLEQARQQSNEFGLSSVWNESDAFIPWDGLCGLSLHFQTCYFSIYTEGDFERRLVKSMADNLERLAQMRTTGESQGWTPGQVETFLMFGTTPPQTPPAEKVAELKRWVHMDVIFNKMAISGFYLVNLLSSSTPARFGAAETVYARALLVPAGLVVWAYDFYFRYTSGGAKYEQTAAYTPYYRDCIHGVAGVDATTLQRQHFPIVYAAWQVTQGRLVNPIEDDGVSNLIHKLGRRSRSKPAKSPQQTAPTSLDEDVSQFSWYEIQGQTDWCNIYSFLGLMIYLDEHKLKADPMCPDNEVLKNAKRAL